jgi:tripartite-type tricarboxylate transporter receptor subunit TctC
VKRHCAAFAIAFSLVAGPALAQDWPTRPVRIVNAFAAGGAADVLARLVADQLSSAFGQQFYVETRAGAAGVIGVQSILHSEPDGYNFVVTSMSLLAVGPTINPRIGYDPLRDLTHIAYIAGTPIGLIVNAAKGPHTFADFIATAKKADRPLTYSTSGVGSVAQLVTEAFARKADIKVEHVPYKGASQGLMDLAGGHIVFSAQTMGSASGQIRGGALSALAHTGSARLPDYPDVPTFKELGYPDSVATNWFSLTAPAGLRSDIVTKINRAVVAAMSDPAVRARLRQDGMVSEAMTPEALNAFVAEEITRWRPVIKSVGLTVEY